jgi:hypothetical protein
MYTEPSDELRDIIQSQFTGLQKRYTEELKRSASHLPEEAIIFRFGLMIGSLTFLISRIGTIHSVSDGTVDEADARRTLPLLVEAYSAIFRAPTGHAHPAALP